jgi:transcriptional regulator with XRE-family HTH domain
MFHVPDKTERTDDLPAVGAPSDPEIATNTHWRSLMRRARDTNGYSQAALARRIGLSQNVVSQIESGEQEASSYILRICRVLKIPPPVAMFADEQDQRWYEAGQLMRRRNPRMFRSQLAAMEAFAADMAAADDEQT